MNINTKSMKKLLFYRFKYEEKRKRYEKDICLIEVSMKKAAINMKKNYFRIQFCIFKAGN